MRLIRTLLLAGCGAALLAAPALAQHGRFHAQKPPGRGQVGTAGAAIPPPQALGPDRSYNGGSYYDGPYTFNYFVPTVVGPDGRVYANFGFGYQQVSRECTSRGYVTYRTRQPRAARQPGYTQPQVTQPVPTAPTSSQAMIKQHPGNAGAAVAGATIGGFYNGNSRADRGACWMRARNGRVTVRR